jgi:thioredoxin 1
MVLIHITNENFEEEVLESKIPVIIDFYANWCMPCKMMAPIFESLSKEYNGKVKFMKLDTEKFPQAAQNFNIQGIPALVLVDKSKEIGRIVGFTSQEVIRKKINNLIK